MSSFFLNFAIAISSKMDNLPALFSDLALILVTAGVTTVIFKWLKQPLVLGYIVAGFLIGPYFTYFPVITDHDSVHVWSEIGMVFLLFAIGLEFSFKKLKKVGSTVGITALTEIVVMLIVGYVLGMLLGWSKMDSIFLGAMLSMSSTTIIAKAFEDLNLKGEKYTESVIGVLIVEDLVAILMMVILSTISVNKAFDGTELLYCVVRLVFFLVAWFIFGIFIIPSLLKRIRKFMNAETITIVAVGLCFVMVVLANYLGFSTALGAFIMGSILAETLEADVIHKVTEPIKDLFGAVFFVSVGMMVSPHIIISYIWPIIIITIIVLTLKSVSSFLGMIISGHSIKSATQAGMCFGQIGEFSFIIATVGMSFGVIDDFLYPIIVSVSIITTFLTPYTIKSATPLYNFIEKRMPERWKANFTQKDEGVKITNSVSVTMKAFLSQQLKNLVIYATIIIALMLLCFIFVEPFIESIVPTVWSEIANCLICLAVVSPFLWAMAFKHHFTATTHKLLANTRFSRNIIITIFILRFIISLSIIVNIITHFFPDVNFWICLGVGFVGSIILALSNHIMFFYDKIEKKFLENLNKRQSQNSFVIPEILQQNFTLGKMVVGVNSSIVGKRLMDTAFRSKYNVSVVCIERGDTIIDLPHKESVFYPYDKVTVVGEEKNIAILRQIIENHDNVLVRERKTSDMNLHKLVMTATHPLCNVRICDSQLKEKFNAMIIAFQHDDDFKLNPQASADFKEGETIWFVSTDESANAIIKMGQETRSNHHKNTLKRE